MLHLNLHVVTVSPEQVRTWTPRSHPHCCCLILHLAPTRRRFHQSSLIESYSSDFQSDSSTTALEETPSIIWEQYVIPQAPRRSALRSLVSSLRTHSSKRVEHGQTFQMVFMTIWGGASTEGVQKHLRGWWEPSFFIPTTFSVDLVQSGRLHCVTDL